jgi:hypothetical protein
MASCTTACLTSSGRKCETYPEPSKLSTFLDLKLESHVLGACSWARLRCAPVRGGLRTVRQCKTRADGTVLSIEVRCVWTPVGWTLPLLRQLAPTRTQEGLSLSRLESINASAKLWHSALCPLSHAPPRRCSRRASCWPAEGLHWRDGACLRAWPRSCVSYALERTCTTPSTRPIALHRRASQFNCMLLELHKKRSPGGRACGDVAGCA